MNTGSSSGLGYNDDDKKSSAIKEILLAYRSFIKL